MVSKKNSIGSVFCLLNLLFAQLAAGTKLLGFPKGVEHPL
jgi:hypothetical protein